MVDGRRQRREHREELAQLVRTLEGSPEGSGKKVLRRLLASGVVSYFQLVDNIPPDSLPEQVGLDLAFFALWPVVTARKLPRGWVGDLAEISSPTLAALVEALRNAPRRITQDNADDLQVLLARTPISFGILNMLEDLNDPKRGASALLALAKAGSGSQPPRKANAKTMMAWMFAATGVGAAGAFGVDAETHATRLADGLWDWLTQHHQVSMGHASSFDPDSFSPSGGHKQVGRPGVLNDAVEEILRHQF